MSHDLPSAELSDPDLDGRDRATSSGSGAPTAAIERNRTGTESPGWHARVKIARLLGRQAAQEHMQPMERSMASRITIMRKPGAPVERVVSAPPRSLKLMSVQGAAEYAHVSTQTVRRAIKAGCLKIYRAGRQIRIDESDLVDYISLQDLKW